jgi:hypothetical protein
MDGFAHDLKILATGWSFFFMLEEVKATVFRFAHAQQSRSTVRFVG